MVHFIPENIVVFHLVKIFTNFWNLNVHYRIHNDLPLELVLKQFISLHSRNICSTLS